MSCIVFIKLFIFYHILDPTFQKHTHTLAQNNLCEFWCGMYLTCKNTPITPDRNGSVKRPEKFRKGMPCPVLDEGSLWWQLRNANCDMPVLGLAGCHWRKNGIGTVQVRAVDHTAYPLQTSVASLATDWCMEPWPPATKRVEVLHLFRWFTFTPWCRRAFLEDANCRLKQSSDTVNWSRIRRSKCQRQELITSGSNNLPEIRSRGQGWRGPSPRSRRCRQVHQVEHVGPNWLP